MLPDNEVFSGIRELFTQKLLIEVETLDADLLDAGVLDSLALIQLLVHLEERFGVKIAVDELEIDDFRSISSIARLVASLKRDSGDHRGARTKEVLPATNEVLARPGAVRA
jgi:D-alanine--poly(phosphoribitol) ligase subunit 2